MNIFQSRLDKIENTNIQNNFKNIIRRITRKGYNIIDDKPFHYKSFNINGNWHSISDEECKFTNYIRSYEKTNKYYDILSTLFNKMYSKEYNVLEDFQLEENNYSDISRETKRLKKIIMIANSIKKIENVPEINELIPIESLKRKEKRYKGIRLFVNIRENGYIDLYLIDLYHLGIDAYNTTTGNYDLERNYNTNKECKKCISKIADECIEGIN